MVALRVRMGPCLSWLIMLLCCGITVIVCTGPYSKYAQTGRPPMDAVQSIFISPILFSSYKIEHGPRNSAAEKQKTKALDQKEEDQDLINPNHVQKKVNISDLGAPRELSRRESSSQMHVAGKTDQAKADLGRLTKIKAEREAVQAMKRKHRYQCEMFDETMAAEESKNMKFCSRRNEYLALCILQYFWLAFWVQERY
ncbi:hypothetical protein CPB85DRAFT_1257306 [Mucidula mucida]|nr:hypothetical protein CPB85DRAFT_1257306 [Mucidula mucida]